MTLRDFLSERGIRMDAAGLLAGVDASTISRIASGKARARPGTVVRLAAALGTSARRMQCMCDNSWDSARRETDEADMQEVPAA
jgi:plasmid maintenance system antidote protein VapI